MVDDLDVDIVDVKDVVVKVVAAIVDVAAFVVVVELCDWVTIISVVVSNLLCDSKDGQLAFSSRVTGCKKNSFLLFS